MPELGQPQQALVADLGRRRPHLQGQVCAGECQVDVGQRLELALSSSLSSAPATAAALTERSRSTRATSRSTSISACLCRLLISTRDWGSM
jgi:hypothetical protein